jgi:hypothetical protein
MTLKFDMKTAHVRSKKRKFHCAFNMCTKKYNPTFSCCESNTEQPKLLQNVLLSRLPIYTGATPVNVLVLQ